MYKQRQSGLIRSPWDKTQDKNDKKRRAFSSNLTT